MGKIKKFISSIFFFILVLAAYLGLYAYFNRNVSINCLSSDVWLYQSVMMQEKEGIWHNFPTAYFRNDIYWAFPILYYLNPGLSGSLAGYHALSLAIIILIYVISGLVIKKIFNSWSLAALGGLLCGIPRK